MATVSPLWPTDINKHFSWPAPWSHEASAPQWRARDSPSPWRMSPHLTPQRHPHLFSFYAQSASRFAPVLSCALKRWTKTVREWNSWKQRRKEGDTSQKAAWLLWVGNDIMRGLQFLVGGSFYSNCQDKCAIIHFDWMTVCALGCMYVNVHDSVCSSVHMCDRKLTKGLRGGWNRDVEREGKPREKKGKWKEGTWPEEKVKGKQKGVTEK